jgi:hypothetical protein
MTQAVNVPGVGTLNFPDGMSQADMAAAIQKNFPQIHESSAQASSPDGFSAAQLGLDTKLYGPNWRGSAPTHSVGPSELTAAQIHQGAVAESAANVAQGDALIPWNERNSLQERLKVPLAATAASIAVPGSGWLALAMQSLMGGAGATVGELHRQEQGNFPTDVKGALEEGGKSAATGFAVGTALKGLGAAAKAIFSTPLPGPAGKAAQFARDEGVPFPLSSAVPGSGASRTQTAARGLLPGEIRTQVDANRVSQFLNQRVGTIVNGAAPLDEAALKGQQYLRQAFEPGETVYTQTFQNLRKTVGDDTAIPLTETTKVLDGVSDALKQRGEMKAVFNRIRNIQKGGATEQTVQQLDELYSGLLKDTARNANARREANVVLSAIGKDIDSVAKEFGMSFSDDVAAAKAVRDQFRELRNIPQLERLSQPFGERGGTLGSRQWMTELFSNPNGKALAELRTRNPELYHELADSYLASNINRFSKPMKDGVGRALDGTALRAWYEQNEGALKLIYGAPQAKALDNFSTYAKYMAGAVDRAANPARISSDPAALLTRGVAEAAALKLNPAIMVPGEAASYVLAKGLSDPSSQLFKVFTEGFSPATRSFVIKSGQLGSQAAATGSSRD